ncbi:MAG TPA: hypothetical protein VK663_15415, partial [Burkholderiales bacterium]|nr:hypothetical protein [Burkholderiales bacterium]
MLLSIPDMTPRADKVHVVRDNETETWRSDYTERMAGVPQVLLVEQRIPGSKILSHFHGVDQFQVIIDGNGKLGQHAVGPVSLHYTNRFTGYGPIEAGPQGMSYYVLRPELAVSGSHYLHVPSERAKMPRGGKRYFMADNLPVCTTAELKALVQPEMKRLMGVDHGDPDSGVFADTLLLGPRMPYTGVDPKSGGGQVFLVLQGVLEHHGKSLAAPASVALTRDEPA